MVQKTIVTASPSLKIIDYRIVEHFDKRGLEEAVMTMIVKYGYELYGSISTYYDNKAKFNVIYCQPMVLYEADEFVNLGGEAV